jgi:NADH dehydrogenase [ubiquinone] 1 alpha subcomplex assembly factor 7
LLLLAFGCFGGRVTPLEKIIIEMIEAEGPMPLDRYMSLCLGHPQHGYYMTRDPFGAAGDFTTAPEISQVFGEMIGVWCVNAWQSLGSPSPFALVELGPGRGTLMADLLRAAKAAPEFLAAVEIHLVEMSPVLQKMQQETLGSSVTWHASVASLPNMPTLFVANEFFDALPVQQFEIRAKKCFERCVGVESGKLKLGLVPSPARPGADGIYEESPVSQAIATEILERIEACGGAALIIDYGHLRTAGGDTLQAMRAHEFCGILDSPGEVDITAHVDFEKLGGTFALTQGDFLKAMGVEMRTEKLAAKLEGEARENFLAATGRLIAADQMGELFKVICVVQKGAPPIYPFEAS